MKLTFKLVVWYFLFLTPSTNRITGFNIPDIVYEYCPFSDICNKSATITLDEKGLVPCCGSCACDDLCGLRLDCCFEELDKYKLIENQIVGCIAPVIGNANKMDSETSYYMVKTCNAFGTLGNVRAPCKLSNGLGKSLVAPVSSLATGYIYVNEECARCNNVQEVTKWGMLYQSSKTTTEFLTTSMISNLGNNDSVGLFVNPANEDWTRKQCYKDVDKRCENENMKDTCEHLKLPFSSAQGSMYGNVFCYFCPLLDYLNISSIPIISKCDAKTRSVSSLMTILVNGQMLDLFSSFRAVSTDLTESNHCLHVKEECLEIHCPQGMMRISLECKYFVERWYASFFIIQIKLLPAKGTRILHSDLDFLTSSEIQQPALWMKNSCWRLSTTTDSIYVEKSPTGNSSVGSFIVKIVNTETSDGFDPGTTIPLLRRCLDNPWTIIIRNVTYMFEATLDKYKEIEYHHSNVSLYNDRIRFLTDYKVTGSDQYTLFIGNKNPPQRKGGMFIKKTFFCPQIYLEDDNVTVTAGGIFIPSMNVTLGNNEYSVNPDGRNSTYAVCIDDLELKPVNRCTDGRHRFSLLVLLIFICYFLLAKYFEFGILI